MTSGKVVVQSVGINARFAEYRLGKRIVLAVVYSASPASRTPGSHLPHHNIANSSIYMGRDFLNHAAHLEPRLFYDIAGIVFHLPRENF